MSNLLRMVYVSTSTTPVRDLDRGVHKDVGRILMQSRKNNPKHEIGGVLYFSNNYFFQCLEGEQEAVNNLFQKITEDKRHNNVQTISVKRISNRQFANWSMKYVALRDNVTRLLQQHGMSDFEPYKFDDEMIDKMLSLFTSEVDNTSHPDQNYNKPTSQKKKTSFISRLFNKAKAA